MKMSIKKIILLILVCIIFITSFFISKKDVINSKQKDILKLTPYNNATDKEDILHILKENFFWIIHGCTFEEYDFASKLEAGVVTFEGEDANKPMNIIVMKDKKRVAGFLTYYVYQSGIGRIHLLGVDKEYRRCGIGEKLARYAIEDLFKQDINVIFLITLRENIRAQNLYKKLGFVQNDELLDGESDSDIVYFVLEKKAYKTATIN
jgi:ribosomal protein S18 acetylase RimI-like enzyme